MKILLFIITYKASHRVAEVVKEIPIYYFKNFNYKILISDDMSQDSTIRYIKRIQQNHKRVILNFNKTNLGYGANILKSV
jgi:glycosyltransferase involved in cell wall biosynthesis